MLATIGTVLLTVGILLGLVAVALSLLWHRLDNKAEKFREEGDEHLRSGNGQEGGVVYDELNQILRSAVRVRVVGIAFLYASAILTLVGALFLILQERVL